MRYGVCYATPDGVVAAVASAHATDMNVLRTFFVCGQGKRLEGVDNHNRMQAQRSLRKVAEKGVRLKGDTIMLFRLSGELPIMGSWHGMIKTRRRCVRLVEIAILLIVRAVGTLPFYCGVPTARCFSF